MKLIFKFFNLLDALNNRHLPRGVVIIYSGLLTNKLEPGYHSENFLLSRFCKYVTIKGDPDPIIYKLL